MSAENKPRNKMDGATLTIADFRCKTFDRLKRKGKASGDCCPECTVCDGSSCAFLAGLHPDRMASFIPRVPDSPDDVEQQAALESIESEAGKRPSGP